MISSIISTAFLSVISVAAASPLGVRSGCQPNFQGSNVDIVTGHINPAVALYLVPETVPPYAGDPVGIRSAEGYPFRPEFEGGPNNAYIIKLGDVSDNSLLLEYKGGQLEVGKVLPTGSPTWTISCNTCASPSKPYKPGDEVGKECSIIDTATGYKLRGVNWDFVAV